LGRLGRAGRKEKGR
jgi:hypothetical protein